MKKSEIIELYNRLGKKVEALNVEYMKLSGNNALIGDCGFGFGSGWMKVHKDTLETNLARREAYIASTEDKIHAIKEKNRIMDTAEGRNFMEDINNRMEVLVKSMDILRIKFREKFNDLLKEIGLGDWEMLDRKATPSFEYGAFDINRTENKDTKLTFRVNCPNGRFEMEVFSSLICGEKETIDSHGRQYWQYRAYVTVCDHSDRVNEWLNSDYRSMAKEEYDLLEEMRKTKEILDDPSSFFSK